MSFPLKLLGMPFLDREGAGLLHVQINMVEGTYIQREIIKSHECRFEQGKQIRPGVILKNYRLDKLIGVGGFAEVYLPNTSILKLMQPLKY